MCLYVRGRRVYLITHCHEGIIVITLCQVVACTCTKHMQVYFVHVHVYILELVVYFSISGTIKFSCTIN